MRHLRAGQDQLARIGDAVAAFRRLAPEDYGPFLATIEAALGEGAGELIAGATPLLLAGPSEEPRSAARSVRASDGGGTLRDAVLALLADGRERSTVEIRRELQASRPVKAGTLNTEIFTLRKMGRLRSEGQGRGRKHTLARGSAATARPAASAGKRETTTRGPRRKRDDDEDHPGGERRVEPGREVGALSEPKVRRVRQGPVLSAEQIYSTAIGAHHLLSAAEELELARRLEDAEISLWARLLGGPLGDEARLRLLELEPPVDPASARQARDADLDRVIATRVIATAGRNPALKVEVAALRVITTEADRIRERFVTCNLRLVPSTIHRHGYHFTTQLAMGDLIQEGNFGLLKAVSRFDYRRGLRFSTFATWWIRHYLVRARQNLGTEVRVPVHLHDLGNKARRAKKQLRAKLGREPDQSELARELKVSVKSIKTLEGTWLKHRESLPVSDSATEEGTTPLYLTSDAALADEVLSRHQEDDQLAAKLARMPPNLVQIVRRRFGLDGAEPETLLQIADSMNLSRERIRQLEKKALSILRQTLIEVAA